MKSQFAENTLIREMGADVKSNPGFIVYLINVKKFLEQNYNYTELETDKFIRNNLEYIKKEADNKKFVSEIIPKLILK